LIFFFTYSTSPPEERSEKRKGGRGLKEYDSPFVLFTILPDSKSTSTTSPSSAETSHSTTGRPMFILFRKNMRAKDFATTHDTPAPKRARGACSRDEPQPKFSSATITSSCFTPTANSGRAFSKAWRASSAASHVTRYSAGIIWSVSTFFPNFQTMPETFFFIFSVFY